MKKKQKYTKNQHTCENQTPLFWIITHNFAILTKYNFMHAAFCDFTFD